MEGNNKPYYIIHPKLYRDLSAQAGSQASASPRTPTSPDTANTAITGKPGWPPSPSKDTVNGSTRAQPNIAYSKITLSIARAGKPVIATLLLIGIIAATAFALLFEQVRIDVQPMAATRHIFSDTSGGTAMPKAVNLSPQMLAQYHNSIADATDPWVISFAGDYYIRSGHYHLLASAPGYIPRLFPLEVGGNGGGNRFLFELEKQPGKLQVLMTPNISADASLNGKPVGKVPNIIPNIPAGSNYLLKVQAKGYSASTKTVSIEGLGKTQTVHITLKLLPPIAKPKVKPKPKPKPRPKPKKPPRISRTQLEQAIGISFVTFPVKQQELTYTKGRKPQTVILTRPFAISRAEVTNLQFRKFHASHSSGQYQGNDLNGDQQPVAKVRWSQAALFANWLSAKAGIIPFYIVQNGRIAGFNRHSTGYRLPSEAEWVYALGAEDKRYYWGRDFERIADKAGNYADVSADKIVTHSLRYYNDGSIVSSQVGSFHPNRNGLYDMEGNAAEWLHDVFTTLVNEERVNPLGLKKGINHIVRGGSWKYGTQRMLKTTYRQYHAGQGKVEVGFRLAYYIK